jgi:hypothetical protein
MWLKASEPAPMEGLQKIENSGTIAKKLLAASLTGGNLAMENR